MANELHEIHQPMSTSTISQQPIIALGSSIDCFPDEQSYSVSVSRNMKGERARIFQAITIPEYMETWLAAADAPPGSTRILSHQESFQILIQSEDRFQSRIHCSYHVCRRNKIVFTWNRLNSPADESLVRIRLQGDFARTTIDVRHSGLSQAEQNFYENFWRASLDRLSSLF